MNILCITPREGWVVDRIGIEFKNHSNHNVNFNNINSEVIWILSPWVWQSIPTQLLQDKKVVCTIHHEVPEKFNQARNGVNTGVISRNFNESILNNTNKDIKDLISIFLFTILKIKREAIKK